MSAAATQMTITEADRVQDETKKTASARIRETHTSELVIALCGPIGSPLHQVGDSITKHLLDKFNYSNCETIRMSEFIRKLAGQVGHTVEEAPEYKRVESLINAGDALRAQFGASLLAGLAVHQIRIQRQAEKKAAGDDSFKPRRVCHIIDSIKNQEELDLLRLIYRDMLFVVGVFSPLDERVSRLSKKMPPDQIYSLIDKDSGLERADGQTVQKTFPNSDFFLRLDKTTDAHLDKRVERFLHLVLGTKVITPTQNESAMYAAAMASANSACLSRQVGAALTDAEGKILSVGWNDVPKFLGGLYPTLDHNGNSLEDDDERCWNKKGGTCFNDEEKDTVAEEILLALEDFVPLEMRENALTIIRTTERLKNLIEFSRAIHAEMHAIINAGHSAGEQMKGGKLFVTTYPCHSCARHIIAAGIKEVYFIEPYRKSLALKLHSDAITESEGSLNKVRLLSYDGVAPSRYLSLFRVPSNSRKLNGRAVVTIARVATPRSSKSMEAIPTLEGLVATSPELLHLLGLSEVKHD